MQYKTYYKGPIIFFLLTLLAGLGLGFLTKNLVGNYALGIFVISFILTGIFALIAFIIRRVAAKFGGKWSIILWIFVIIITLATPIIYIRHLEAPLLHDIGLENLPNHSTSLDGCKYDGQVKYDCALNYIIQAKDRNLCLTTYGNTDNGYSCEFDYDQHYGISPANISECQNMVATEYNGLMWKDGCFSSVAISTLNKQVCSYVSTTDGQANCTARVDAKIHTK